MTKPTASPDKRSVKNDSDNDSDGLPTQLTVLHIAAAEAALDRVFAAGGDGGDAVVVDLSNVERIDSIGAALLATRSRGYRKSGGSVRFVGARPAVAATLRMLPAVAPATDASGRGAGVFERLGGDTHAGFSAVVGLGSLFADTAHFAFLTLIGRYRLRPGTLAWELSNIGSRALGVVGLISFLVGGTMALQAAAQLRRFGADLYVVDLVTLSMLRELGPLMAAIVVAGRSGSAIAAEIGTMVVTEEVDALRTLGLDPVRFLVVPKVLAFTIAQPLLTIFANVLGVLGGFAVAVLYLDIGPGAFFARLRDLVEIRDLLTGLGKAVVFGWLICLIGAAAGMATRGGAEAVGRSTTSAVVTGIFAVVLADAVASIFLWF